jgi:hypothetical protein
MNIQFKGLVLTRPLVVSSKFSNTVDRQLTFHPAKYSVPESSAPQETQTLSRADLQVQMDYVGPLVLLCEIISIQPE